MTSTSLNASSDSTWVPGAPLARIKIYSRAFCPYCLHAKSILARHGFKWREIRVDDSPQFFEEMKDDTNGATKVPQILINGRHIGGLDELMMIEHLKEWPRYLRAPKPGEFDVRKAQDRGQGDLGTDVE